MFTRRNESDLYGNPGLQDRVRAALRERGGQMILFGDTGVGKKAADEDGAEPCAVVRPSARRRRRLLGLLSRANRGLPERDRAAPDPRLYLPVRRRIAAPASATLGREVRRLLPDRLHTTAPA